MRRIHTALLSTVALVAGLSAQPVTAADLALKAPVAPAFPVPRWDGAFVSFSAGGTWTKADERFTDSGTNVNTLTQSDVGFLSTDTTTTQFVGSDSQQSTNNNRTGGAVFTFTTGYNFVWGSWLVGYQSEVSLNRNNIRLEGTGSNSSSSTSQRTATLGGTVFTGIPSISTNANNFATFSNLEHKWTISEMARVGFLLRPDILLYGLGGWSWAGFNWAGEQGGQVSGPVGPVGLVAVDPSFTMNGPTWGVGLEKDFGWLRGFVQYKGIHFRDKDVNVSSPSNSASTFTQGTNTQTFTSTTADTATRTFSANYAEITGGIIIPLNNFR